MNRFLIAGVLMVGACGLALNLGCSKEEPAAPVATDQPEMEGMTVDTAAIDAELAKLSEADRAVVVAQKVCPVTKEPLGSMGPPLKVTVDGKDLYICCEGCREKATANFAEYFAELGKTPAAAATN